MRCASEPRRHRGLRTLYVHYDGGTFVPGYDANGALVEKTCTGDSPAAATYQHDLRNRPDMAFGEWLPAIRAGLRWRPDVIWLLPTGTAADPDAWMAELRRANAVSKTVINTSIAYMQYRPAKDLHFVWRIAHETGGICIDAAGEPVPEPVVPPPPNNDPEQCH